jgi:hypothetical protein
LIVAGSFAIFQRPGFPAQLGTSTSDKTTLQNAVEPSDSSAGIACPNGLAWHSQNCSRASPAVAAVVEYCKNEARELTTN